VEERRASPEQLVDVREGGLGPWVERSRVHLRAGAVHEQLPRARRPEPQAPEPTPEEEEGVSRATDRAHERGVEDVRGDRRGAVEGERAAHVDVPSARAVLVGVDAGPGRTCAVPPDISIRRSQISSNEGRWDTMISVSSPRSPLSESWIAASDSRSS